MYIADRYIGRFEKDFFDNGFWSTGSQVKSSQVSPVGKSFIEKARRKREKTRKKRKKGKNTTHSLSLSSLSSLPLYSREHFTSLHFKLSSAHFTSKPNQPIYQSQNVHNRRPLHSTSHLAFLPPPIPPPLHPLLPLLHHTNHDPHHLSHHPKTKTTPPTHLGRNFPLNSMDTFTFADNSPMHEQQQQ